MQEGSGDKGIRSRAQGEHEGKSHHEQVGAKRLFSDCGQTAMIHKSLNAGGQQAADD
ncbi:hypothetical protein D3C73_1651120 [compost metagenome]